MALLFHRFSSTQLQCDKSKPSQHLVMFLAQTLALPRSLVEHNHSLSQRANAIRKRSDGDAPSIESRPASEGRNSSAGTPVHRFTPKNVHTRYGRVPEKERSCSSSPATQPRRRSWDDESPVMVSPLHFVRAESPAAVSLLCLGAAATERENTQTAPTFVMEAEPELHEQFPRSKSPHPGTNPERSLPMPTPRTVLEQELRQQVAELQAQVARLQPPVRVPNATVENDSTHTVQSKEEEVNENCIRPKAEPIIGAFLPSAVESADGSDHQPPRPPRVASYARRAQYVALVVWALLTLVATIIRRFSRRQISNAIAQVSELVLRGR